MRIYNVGKWIKVTYWNDEFKYFKTLPKDLSNINSIRYLCNGSLHREDGSAFAIYYKNGTVKSDLYCLNDKTHKEDGPAEIWYNKSGEVNGEYYYLHDNPLSKEEWEKQIENL